ncbi:RNA polymerase sigma factor [Sphingopyxis sp. L1A2A]|uniref:RNA polymerase sigma factor n=1 Tax=Sphingopyxis sp. L1A2A TaxID=2502247 RepID=UPI0010F9405B|nr:RNA polymerase sigma factor [Sphingopyxis sp. L1A2A]
MSASHFSSAAASRAPRLPRSAPLREKGRADEDWALNQRVAGGDRAAFQLLVLRHEGRLRAFLARAAGCDADDLAQEAFVRAWQRAGDFRGQGSYAAWIMGIGWRLFLDQRRTAQRREGLAQGDDVATATDPRGASDAAIDADRLLGALSPQERAALTLCFGHGWSHGDAAEIMGVPLGTLKSLVLRGRAKAQKMIGEGADA